MNRAVIRKLAVIVLIGFAAPLLFAQQQKQLNYKNQLVSDANLAHLDYDIELNLTNSSVEEALIEIAEKSNLRLMYSKILLPNKQITLQEESISIYDALWTVLEGSNLRYAISQNRQLVLLKMDEEERPNEKEIVEETIRGQVVDAETGETLPGVNIIIQGTNDGAVTNLDGNFELTVPDLQQVLVVSYVGYDSQEIAINGRTQFDIELVSSVAALDDFVVTAFGLERERKSLGYSVQEIEGASLSTAREVNVANSLQGRVAGVHVSRSSAGAGGSSSVTIRGSNSFTSSNQPLYIVDGFPIDNSNLGAASVNAGRDYGDGIGNINPDDIESMTVLKGPSAAALYGSRGANGVILVTTKKGNADLDRMEITVNTGATYDMLNVMPTFQNMYGGGYGGNLGSFRTQEVDGVLYPMYTNNMYDHWGAPLDGRMITVENMPELGVIPYSPQPSDNIKEVYRTGQTLNNNISFSGGTGQTAFRLSLSDMRNQHILPNTELNRQSINLQFNSAIRPNLTVEGKINYIHQEGQNRPEVGYGRGSGSIPAALNEMGRFVELDWLKDYKRPDGTQVNYQARTPQNPYWILNEMLSEDTRQRIIGNMTLNYEINEWLSLTAKGGTDFYNDARFERVGAGTFGGSNIDGNMSSTDYAVQEENFEVMLTADRYFTEDFSGLFSIGANHLNQNREIRGFNGSILMAPGVYEISNFQNVTPRSSVRRKQINSVYGLAQFGYKDYLFLDLTGRNDWSSTLSPENRSFFYPSATISFSFTDMMDINPDLLTYGKLRVSVAQAGNDADPYMTHAGYTNSNNDFNGYRFANINNTIPVTDLKNELTTSYEIGTDLRFFQNRVGIDFTYYQSATSNQILSTEIAGTSGYSRRTINAGEISNKGFEVMLNIAPVRTSDFLWDINVNASKNSSEVVSLFGDLESLTLLSAGSGATIVARPGLPFGNIVGFEYKKNEEGQRVFNENGSIIRGDEPVVLGNIQPDYLGGFTNTFSYKRFHLGALIDFRVGGQIFSHTKYRQLTQGTGKMTENREAPLIFEGVIENEDGTYRENDQPVTAQTYYAPRGWSNITEEFVIDADYASLREITFGYQFGGGLLETLRISSARFSIVARNLFYLYRDPEFELMGVAPEGTFNTTTAAQGVESANMPTTRSLGFNLSFTL